MSADDSIEIEFPSLNRSAPELVEGATSKRAPGPIEAQLTGSSGDDDLSWLSAIFADDEDDEDEADDPARSDDAAPEHARGEPPMAANGPIDDPPDDLSEGLANVVEDESVEGVDHDTSPPSVRLHAFEDIAEDEIEDAAPGEPETQVDTDQSRVDTDPDPIDGENDPQPSSSSKKVTGFREEIMSTFSQMYN